MPKLPFAIAMKDDRPFTFAGLWENWKDSETEKWIRTCTIITGEPNELVAQIYPRMPVIIPEQHHAAWLEKTDDGNVKSLQKFTRPLPCRSDAHVGNLPESQQPEE
jgi:putative SOS response-associated peptidase YedK